MTLMRDATAEAASALHRAARGFVRRLAHEALERAALDYARALGWTPPESRPEGKVEP